MLLADYIDEKPVLASERLTLRTMTKEDVNDLLEWTPDPSIYTYWGKKPGKSDKNPALLFEKPEPPSKSFHWGIALNESGKIIGELWIYLIESDRMAKLAIRLSPSCHGKGYATEAIKCAMRFCFTQTELKRIWTDVDVRNTASCRVLEKCGFTREGMIRQGKMVSTWCDYYIYGMLREDHFPD